tara:strand:+ start:268 stop:2337 length:2070 start_codon:yes stop_codon:yes gene_type:complete
MSQLSRRLRQAAAGSAGPTLVRDVFSADLYTGTNTTQTINNGVDLTKGGLVWIKSRNLTESHRLYDTSRGAHKYLSCDSSGGEQDLTSADEGVSAFNNNGFTIKGNDNADNNHGMRYAAWTFRECANFFAIATWTGDGNNSRTITHSLNGSPGMIAIKNRDRAEDWIVWTYGVSGVMSFNSPLAHSNSSQDEYTPGTGNTITSPLGTTNETTEFTIGNGDAVNKNGDTYVAYIWANHVNGSGAFGPDEDQDIIKFGTYTGDNATFNEQNVGFEPQFSMHRNWSHNDPWNIYDTTRGWPHTPSGDPHYPHLLEINTTAVESHYGNLNRWSPLVSTSTLGLPVIMAQSSDQKFNASSRYYWWMAIRHDYEEATSRSEFFDLDHTQTAVTADAISVAPMFHSSTGRVDWGVTKNHSSTSNWLTATRLTNRSTVSFISPGAFAGHQPDYGFDFSGCITGTNNGWFGRGTGNSVDAELISWMWRRKKKLFDMTTRRGTGTNGTAFNHYLGTTPEMIWTKNISAGSTDFLVYHKDLTGSGYYLRLNNAGGEVQDNHITNVLATSYTIPQANSNTNTTDNYYIHWFFATVAGIAKVGSYTGTGSSEQTIDCGFTNGTKFLIIKYKDGTGDWLWFDNGTELDFGAGANDRYLKIQTNAGRSSAVDYINPVSSGFKVPANQTATNALNSEYIFYAIAE